MTLFFLDSYSSESNTSENQSGVVDVVLAARRKKKPAGPDVKLILQVVLALVFILSLVMFDDVKQVNSASLTLYVGDHKRVFVGEVVPGMTVLDAVNAATLAGNVKFSFMTKGEHIKIVNLGGVNVASQSNRYALFVNSAKIDPDTMGSIAVNVNDSIVLKLLPGHTQ